MADSHARQLRINLQTIHPEEIRRANVKYILYAQQIQCTGTDRIPIKHFLCIRLCTESSMHTQGVSRASGDSDWFLRQNKCLFSSITVDYCVLVNFLNY